MAMAGLAPWLGFLAMWLLWDRSTARGSAAAASG
jgi:hypothetical protein